MASNDAKYYLQGALLFLIIFAVIAGACLLVWALTDDDTKSAVDKFTDKCDKVGGVVAVYEHAKESDELYCIKANKVVLNGRG